MLRPSAAAFALALCLGCKGSNGDGAGGASGASGGAAGYDDFAALACQRARHCCAQEGLSTTPLDNCEAESVEQSDFFQALERGTAVLIEPEYSDCLEQLRAVSDVCDLGALVGAMCSPFFRGTVEPGGTCNDAAECATNGDPVVCLRAGDLEDSEPGVCQQPARGQLGDRCIISADEHSYGITYGTPEPDPPLVFCGTDDGLYCAFPGHVCTAFLAEGAECAELEECEPGLYCDTTCKPAKTEGSPCTDSDECALPAFCDGTACVRLTYADTDICEGDLD